MRPCAGTRVVVLSGQHRGLIGEVQRHKRASWFKPWYDVMSQSMKDAHDARGTTGWHCAIPYKGELVWVNADNVQGV